MVAQTSAQDDLEMVNLDPSFEDGFGSWGQYINPAASAIFKLDKDAFDGDFSAYIDVKTISGTNWHVGLTQDALTLEAGEMYTIDFFAKVDAKRTIALEVKRSPALGDWEGITSSDIIITEEWAEYSVSFTPALDYEQGAFLGFWLGQVEGEVWIDSVRFYLGEKQDREVAQPEPPRSVDANGKLITLWSAIRKD
jgi:hypothetical protein